jgi:hypothetical protein
MTSASVHDWRGGCHAGVTNRVHCGIAGALLFTAGNYRIAASPLPNKSVAIKALERQKSWKRLRPEECVSPASLLHHRPPDYRERA